MPHGKIRRGSVFPGNARSRRVARRHSVYLPVARNRFAARLYGESIPGYALFESILAVFQFLLKAHYERVRFIPALARDGSGFLPRNRARGKPIGSSWIEKKNETGSGDAYVPENERLLSPISQLPPGSGAPLAKAESGPIGEPPPIGDRGSS